MRGASDDDKGRRWGISRRPNPPIGRFLLTPDVIRSIGDEGEALARAARARQVGAVGSLVEWALSVAELAQQSSAHLRREGDYQRDWAAQQQAREMEVQVLVRVAGPLLRGAGAGIRGHDPHELWALEDPASSLRRDLSLLAPSHLGRYPMRPPTVIVPSLRRAVVSGVGVVVGEVPGETTQIPSTVSEGLALFRRGAEAQAPWLLKGPLASRSSSRGPWSVAPILLVPYDGHGQAGYTHDAAVVRLHMPRAAANTPPQIAHIIAHEEAHHVWQTRVSDEGRAAWARLVRERTVPLDASEVLAAWPDEYRHWHFLSAAQHIAEGVVRRSGPLAYQIVIAARDRAVRDLDRRDFERWAAEGNSVQVPEKPVSVYGHTSAEEAFCDAFALLVARGPRTVDPEALDLLRELVPRTRVSNPGRGGRSSERAASPRRRNGSGAARGVSRNSSPRGESCGDVVPLPNGVTLEMLREVSRITRSEAIGCSQNRDDWCGKASSIAAYYLNDHGVEAVAYDSIPHIGVGGVKIDPFHSWVVLGEDGTIIDTTVGMFVSHEEASSKQRRIAACYPHVAGVPEIAVVPAAHPYVARMGYESHTTGRRWTGYPVPWLAGLPTCSGRGAPLDPATPRRRNGARDGASRVVHGDIASLHRYLAQDVNPHDFERFLPRYFADLHPSYAEQAGFDPGSARGFLNTRQGREHVARFRNWLRSNLYSLGGEIFYEQSYFHFGDPQVLPKRTWLIHFASKDDADKIIKRGFMGTTDTAALAATRHLKKVGPGWNFAYVVGVGSDRMAAHDELYGDHALLFQASAVHARHENDGDWQAIFWGPDVSRAIVIRRGRRNSWDVIDASGAVAHEGDPWTESLDAACDWARKHASKLWRRVGVE